MKSFPLFFQVSGRHVVIVGGGEQAAQKARLLLKTDARVTLLAPQLEAELAALVASGRARHQTGFSSPSIFQDAALVFIGTGCPGLDASVHALAKAAGAIVNVVDQPDLCDVTTPSIVDRDPVVVAIGTEGTAPVLGRQIKTRIERLLDPSLGAFAALAGRLRPAVAGQVPRDQRRGFWRWVFAGPAWAAHKRGNAREAARMIKAAIAQGGVPDRATAGRITLVGAGPGARDLLTLRAVERLQEADVIYYDRLVDPDVLELARRDARRVFVGKTPGSHSWPQDRINSLIVSDARRGAAVVRLKSGDPGLFGRAAEELHAARSAGVDVEIVPGITAASAASASIGAPLTERGQTEAVVLATGALRDQDELPDWGRWAAPGTTMAIYMGVANAAAVQRSLLAAGVPGSADVTIAVSVESPQQRSYAIKLADLARVVSEQAVPHPAVIMVTYPKTAQDTADRGAV